MVVVLFYCNHCHIFCPRKSLRNNIQGYQVTPQKCADREERGGERLPKKQLEDGRRRPDSHSEKLDVVVDDDTDDGDSNAMMRPARD